MGWHKDGKREWKGYHHGILREALVDAALKLISDKRPAGLTFADAARAALFGRGDISRRPIPMPPGGQLEAGVLVYLEGLDIKRS
ncbi:MAG: hypothetical protein K0U74_09805 [Alphaproteobacteria bacterium]|nr:hypothetical protein [Alphaproteobacteria bacterium]